MAGTAPSRQTGPVQKITLSLGDGGQLVAYESGSATDGRPTVALLHGIGMTHLTWARVQPLLAPTHHVVSFDLSDGKTTVHVRNEGNPPQMFREGIGVVVEGTMTSAGVFESQRLMVSHNNEYRAPKNGHPVDKKQMEKYIKDAQ